MNDPALTSEIEALARGLYGADPHLDELIDNLIAIHRTRYDRKELAAVLPRLAGEDSVLRLLSLVVEAKADSKAVADLDSTDRHATKAALHGLAADLDHLTDRADADKATRHLDPA
ncbi:hypothetical protein AB0B07_33110 [Streptomyces sioyaensis]|uniref:hypothetical protein n=1 Tax=Streptomyces sioyaensis TaxID=67364 RepID=UPI0033F49052